MNSPDSGNRPSNPYVGPHGPATAPTRALSGQITSLVRQISGMVGSHEPLELPNLSSLDTDAAQVIASKYKGKDIRMEHLTNVTPGALGLLFGANSQIKKVSFPELQQVNAVDFEMLAQHQLHVLDQPGLVEDSVDPEWNLTLSPELMRRVTERARELQDINRGVMKRSPSGRVIVPEPMPRSLPTSSSPSIPPQPPVATRPVPASSPVDARPVSHDGGRPRPEENKNSKLAAAILLIAGGVGGATYAATRISPGASDYAVAERTERDPVAAREERAGRDHVVAREERGHSDSLTEESERLVDALKVRFEANMVRHPGVTWSDVQRALTSHPDFLEAVNNMERQGGEPDVIFVTDKHFVFGDTASEVSSERRGYSYIAAQNLAQRIHPNVKLMSDFQYRALQRADRNSHDRTQPVWLRDMDHEIDPVSPFYGQVNSREKVVVVKGVTPPDTYPECAYRLTVSVPR